MEKQTKIDIDQERVKTLENQRNLFLLRTPVFGGLSIWGIAWTLTGHWEGAIMGGVLTSIVLFLLMRDVEYLIENRIKRARLSKS